MPSIPFHVGVQSKAVKTMDFKRVTVDTTVQEKAVSYPTDSNRTDDLQSTSCTLPRWG